MEVAETLEENNYTIMILKENKTTQKIRWMFKKVDFSKFRAMLSTIL